MDSSIASLSANGNCLGLAISHVAHLINKELDDEIRIQLSDISTVHDAVRILDIIGRPQLMMRTIDYNLISFLRKYLLNPGRLSVINQSELQDGAVCLCLRSLNQLYTIKSAQGHWIVLHKKLHNFFIIDDLAPIVNFYYPEMRATDPNTIINQFGTTLVIGA